jgi:hypothetical protein
MVYLDCQLDWNEKQKEISKAQLQVSLRGCFYRGFTDVGRPAQNVDGTIPWGGGLDEIKKRRRRRPASSGSLSLSLSLSPS